MNTNDKSGWISVEDRLPEIGTIVLITDGDSVEAGCMILNEEYPFRFIQDDNSVEHIDDESWFSINAYIKKAVTHWQPLPQPPQTKNS